MFGTGGLRVSLSGSGYGGLLVQDFLADDRTRVLDRWP